MRGSSLLAIGVVLLVECAFADVSYAQPLERVHALSAYRIEAHTITLDGRLSEPEWTRAEAAHDFVQRAPNPGAPASRPTVVRILRTDDALYVGMELFDDTPDAISAQLVRRDTTDAFSDWAYVFIDSYYDRRTAFGFGVNPRGVQFDALYFNDGAGRDTGWDPVWEVATHVGVAGWSAELRIPLSQIRFSRGGSTWGIQFGRIIARLNETAYWAPVPPDSRRFVSLFGTLSGVGDLDTPRYLEVVPYTKLSGKRTPVTAGEYQAAAGADMKYGLTPGLTLTGTINPDFGQVEADPSVVNLTAFESFFPEKRPFFIEGTDVFRFGLGLGGSDSENEQVFYSRRIGRPPQGTASGGQVLEQPEAAAIIAAAKLSGQTVNGWSVGLLNAVVDDAHLRYTTPLGEPATATVEPVTNYVVARATRNMRDGRSSFGAIATGTHRRIEDRSVDFLHRSAYVVGVDGRHRLEAGRYEVSGQFVGSIVRGSPTAIARTQRSSARFFQRPDKEHSHFDPDRTSLAGWAGTASFIKLAGQWQWALLGLARSPGFEVNDLGFQRNADHVLTGAFLSYRDDKPGRLVNDWTASVGGGSSWTFGGEHTGANVNFNGRIQLRSFWGGFLFAQYSFATLSPTELRGGPALRMPERLDLGLGLFSDKRKALWTDVNGFSTIERETRASVSRVSANVTWRVSDQLQVSLGPQLSVSNTPWQYVTQQAVPFTGVPCAHDVINSTVSSPTCLHYIFAGLDHRTLAATIRVNYTLHPTVTFQFYGQPFISAGNYHSFLEVRDAKARRFSERFGRLTADQMRLTDGSRSYVLDIRSDGDPDARFANPNFGFGQLRSNAVLRWEYRPGSVMFFVWSHGRTAMTQRGSFSVERGMSELFDAKGTDVILVKLSYWLDW